MEQTGSPNQVLQHPAAALLVSRSSLALSAAAAAELWSLGNGVVWCLMTEEYDDEQPFDWAQLPADPGGPHTAEQRYELAPFHSITSSARASSSGGTSRPRLLVSRLAV